METNFFAPFKFNLECIVMDGKGLHESNHYRGAGVQFPTYKSLEMRCFQSDKFRCFQILFKHLIHVEFEVNAIKYQKSYLSKYCTQIYSLSYRIYHNCADFATSSYTGYWVSCGCAPSRGNSNWEVGNEERTPLLCRKLEIINNGVCLA